MQIKLKDESELESINENIIVKDMKKTNLIAGKS